MAIGRSKNQEKNSPTIATVRRSQIVSTYGIGALIPIEQESFIVLGQDSWPKNWLTAAGDGQFQNEIVAPAFASALGVSNLFPPPANDFYRLPVRRFPEMYLCSRCGALDFWSELSFDRSASSHFADCTKDNANLMPSRFVAVCPNGHIQEFPYHKWVHKDSGSECNASNSRLRLKSDSTDDSLAGLTIICSCGSSRTLEGALGRNNLGKCKGKFPWLEQREDALCSKELIGLQRGATNVWQSVLRSAITVPTEGQDDDLNAYIDENLGLLLSLVEKPDNMRNQVFRLTAEEGGFDVADFTERVNRRLGLKETTDPLLQLHDAEYVALQESHVDSGTSRDFICLPQELSADIKERTRFSSISSVPRLREVRALAGFTRAEPNTEEHFNPASLLSSKPENWLPAIEAWGEGIFIKIAEDQLQAWESRGWAEARLARIQNSSRTTKSAEATTRHLLLHSLSHILINQLALVAGYTASSIRERIYSNLDQSGILLYTAGTDSAGSLGGLSALGNPEDVQRLLLGALETARWCTADPVCIESNVRGLESLNLAACHYCMFLPEVSCEGNNVLLDRALLVGTPQDPDEGFYSAIFNE